MKYESQNALSLFESEQKKTKKPVGPCLYVYAKDAIKQRGVSLPIASTIRYPGWTWSQRWRFCAGPSSSPKVLLKMLIWMAIAEEERGNSLERRGAEFNFSLFPGGSKADSS